METDATWDFADGSERACGGLLVPVACNSAPTSPRSWAPRPPNRAPRRRRDRGRPRIGHWRARPLRGGRRAPGGILLVAGHAGSPSWSDHDHGIHLPTPDEVLDDLALPAGRWEVRRCESVTREFPGPDGAPGTRPDNVLTVERLGG